MNAVAEVVVPAAAGSRRAPWVAALVALGLGLVPFGFLFAEEGTAAIATWDRSTAYNHCWLVLPIAAWLAWNRRDRLAGLLPAPSPLLALLALPAVLAWLVAERLGIMEGRQLAALALLEVLVLAVLGWRICRAMAGPLAYLVFLVPFGAFAVPALQAATAWMIGLGLRLLGITHYIDGFVIETTSGTYLVAEACAGLRFIIAALAFGALYALTMFRSPGRRLLVMVLALVVPIIANGLRALGIVVLGQYLGSAEAAAADHVIYGWGFFSVVILLLILAGLPFREDGAAAPAHPPAVPDTAAPRGAALAAAAGLAVALAALGPALAAGLDSALGGPATAVPARLTAPEGCTATAEGAALHCPGATVSARLLVFPSRVTWAPVAAERRRATGGDEEEDSFGIRPSGGMAAWQARQFRAQGESQGGGQSGTVAVAAWLEGRPAGDGLRTRATQAWNSLRGGGGAPVVAMVTLQAEGPQAEAAGQAHQRALLQAVLEAQGPGLVAQATALSGGR
ncbi:exosortase A [Siccirubricoccus sp. G192]|uniref:exosortase A n=1 Tax=Siccirubricoccus sp. G192 TaxID=2849651 RepID=UPI001C2C81DB|nr:exosortase A [Siccirubricoccus sp. G192]MBV1800017.1 exosortase [Siccirubricoccus sp. G192]